MPLLRVPFDDGYEWFISMHQVIVPIKNISTLSATEIGERILALVPRIEKARNYHPDWEPFQTIETMEAWIDRLEERSAKNARKIIKTERNKLRQEISSTYERTFLRIARRDGFHCKLCQSTKELEIDHIIPVAHDGTNELANLQLLCKDCNREKRDH